MKIHFRERIDVSESVYACGVFKKCFKYSTKLNEVTCGRCLRRVGFVKKGEKQMQPGEQIVYERGLENSLRQMLIEKHQKEIAEFDRLFKTNGSHLIIEDAQPIQRRRRKFEKGFIGKTAYAVCKEFPAEFSTYEFLKKMRIFAPGVYNRLVKNHSASACLHLLKKQGKISGIVNEHRDATWKLV